MYLICGEALYDLFVDDGLPAPEGEAALRAIAGGSPFNVAIGMARLGEFVGLASDLARDALGERLVRQLRHEGVADLFLRRSAATTALAIVRPDATGSPSYSFLGLEDATYGPAVGALERSPIQVRGIHVGSIAIALPRSAHLLLDLVSRAAEKTFVSLDPNIRLSIIPDVAIWHDAVEKIRVVANIVKISEEDIAALYGDIDPAKICTGWLNDRTALVILTRGANGASLFSSSAGRIDVPAMPTNVADTVGAGDSFMAALLSMLRRYDLLSSRALASLDANRLCALGEFASLAASVTCSRRGPVLPTYAEMQSRAAAL